MKKILLTSAGFLNPKIAKEFINILPKKIEDIKILVISYVQNDDEQYYVDKSKKELISLGFEKIQNLNLNEDFDIELLGDFEVIYICGGNTYLILDKLKKTCLFDFIKKQVEKGSVFVGVSAGSIIAGDNIEIAGWGSEGDKNEINLQDLAGFSFTDGAIFPHLREELKIEVEEFKNKANYRVIGLTDNQAFLVIDNKEKIIE